MENNKAFLKNPWVIGGVAFVVGLIIGLVVLGWWLWPVKWINASPANLEPSFQEDYLRMAIDSFTLNGNVNLAQTRFQALGKNGPSLLETISKNPGEQTLESIQAFAAVVRAPGANPSGGLTAQNTAVPGVKETPAPGATAIAPSGGGAPSSEETGGKKKVGPLIIVLASCGVLILLLVVIGLVLYLRKQNLRPKEPQTPVQMAQQASRQAEYTDYTAEGREPPLAQFMSTYMKGDDLFDDSFSIDAPNGEFLGECGVGIADTIGVGEPKKVIALEVWLFDKNDIQTVTKVLMSEHAFNDESIRQRLATKGEPVLAQPGQTFVLETETLQMVARVVDMAYGEGALPEHSFFEHVTLELSVWRKETAG